MVGEITIAERAAEKIRVPLSSARAKQPREEQHLQLNERGH
jgi:hypothetical protein